MASGKGTALITGASSGIGATFARQLAAQGYDLVLVARRVERLDELARELTPRGNAVETLAADLTADADVARIADRLASCATLTLLVNNAGFGTKGFFHQTDAAGQEAMHRLHVLATERLTRAALPGMVGRGRGGVINVSSVAAFLQGVSNVSYCATKAWMNSFSEGLWLEMQALRSPVKIQALCPGFTYSEFHDVMQINRAEIPQSWWLPAELVVAESLRELAHGKLIVIPSTRYKALVWLIRRLPRAVLQLGARRYRKPRL